MAKVSLRAYNREIEMMIDRGQLDEAIAHCHHILKIFPKHLDTYRLLGKAYLESKRYGDAADLFLRILASVPNDFVAQVGMSIIRDEENKLDDAIWHMERAFETQPSNPAIQSELQRLYGRRDGVQPPRIRMTRGALANMYVQGELYPQAISEIRSVLKEDPQRADMQALLARACFRSGQKNEAADVASALLRRYPYSLDANRVLAEILGAERPENAQLYRQRVVEMDPYASQVTGTMFQSNEVPEAAVSIERLDWNGQPVSMQSDWGETRAISLESGTEREVQPDWMQGPFGDVNPPSPSQPTPASMFESTAPAQAQPTEEIPDFLRAAGWGESTGAFDESKSTFASEESKAEAQPLAQGDLPDWVKAMKPAEAEPAASQSEEELPDWVKAMKPQDSAPAAREPEEELPDWINNIGTGAISSQPSEEVDWLGQTPQSSPTPASDQADWLNQLNQPASTPAEEQPDWMSQLSQQEQTIPLPSEDQPDWLKGLGGESESVSPAASADDLDWLKGLGSEADITPQPAQTETPDWLKELGGEPEATPAESTSTEFDFLNQPTEESVSNAPESTPSAEDLDKLGVSEQERDDSFAWLESLAANQGASEGLLTKPEDRLEEEPEWVKRAKGLSTTPPSTTEPAVSQPAASVEDLGKMEQEQEDSFAWLENLAAKQGATEGLLTQPEERREEEPDWVKQVKGLGTQEPAAPVTPAVEPEPQLEAEQPAKADEVEEWLQNLEGHTAAEPEPVADETATWSKSLEDTQPSKPVSLPSASLEELGKSEQEQDDSFAWLENLAAKQGATEGLLTKPEERREEEPDWVKQAKDLSAQEITPPATAEPEAETPAAMDDTGIWLRSLEAEDKAAEPTAGETATWLKNLEEEEKTSQPEAAADDTAMWLKSLEEGKLPEAEPAADETAMWLKSLDQEETAPARPEPEASTEALPEWLQNIEQEETPVAETTIFEQETKIESVSEMPSEEAVHTEEFKLEEESIPNWLADLDKEEEKPVSVSADDDLPAWLRAEETAPAAAEPTRPTDWQPREEKEEERPPEIVYSPPLEEPEQPKIIYSPPLEETPEPEPVAQKESFELPEELRVEPLQEEPALEPVQSRETTPPPYQEPASRSVPGVVVPNVDPVLGMARNELSRNNINSALESYARLIKKGRFLDEVIFDLRDAVSYRYPVDVNVWQSLGDAYMRANRLQDALDAYTKAEELLR
jgi:tetratricopeptide (TPR) repeat protein